MSHHQEQRTRPPGWGVPTGIGVGAALGILVGVMVDQLALGIGIGAGVGLVAGAALTATNDLPERQRRAIIVRAAAILLVGIASAVLILTTW